MSILYALVVGLVFLAAIMLGTVLGFIAAEAVDITMEVLSLRDTK